MGGDARVGENFKVERAILASTTTCGSWSYCSSFCC